jgi:hypothetical protein
MQRAAQRARRQRPKESSDAASGEAGKTSTMQRNKRYSERRGGQVVDKRKKQAMRGAAWRASRRQAKATSDAASGVVGKSSTSGRNQRRSERRGGQDVDKQKKRGIQ